MLYDIDFSMCFIINFMHLHVYTMYTVRFCKVCIHPVIIIKHLKSAIFYKELRLTERSHIFMIQRQHSC